jgi:hypothetical protein
MRAFAVETGLPEEIDTDADIFRIKVPANPKRGAKWRQLEANRWRLGGQVYWVYLGLCKSVNVRSRLIVPRKAYRHSIAWKPVSWSPTEVRHFVFCEHHPPRAPIASPDGKTLIPDIIAVKDRQAVVIDPTIIYENSDHSLQSANKAKILKYIPLTNEIKTLYGADKVEFQQLCTFYMQHLLQSFLLGLT